MWIIVTDRFKSAANFWDASGILPPYIHVEWGDGLRGFCTDKDEMIVFTFDDAKRFKTREEAEALAFAICVKLPYMIGHVMVLTEIEATTINNNELAEWFETQTALKKGLNEK